MHARLVAGLTAAAICCGAAGAADSSEFSGFLSDYSEFAPPPGDNIVDLIWVAPDLRDRFQGPRRTST